MNGYKQYENDTNLGNEKIIVLLMFLRQCQRPEKCFISKLPTSPLLLSPYLFVYHMTSITTYAKSISLSISDNLDTSEISIKSFRHLVYHRWWHIPNFFYVARNSLAFSVSKNNQIQSMVNDSDQSCKGLTPSGSSVLTDD